MVFFKFCGHETNSFVNLLLQLWFVPVGADDFEISAVFGCFHFHSGVRLILELMKPMFEPTSGICGKYEHEDAKISFSW